MNDPAATSDYSYGGFDLVLLADGRPQLLGKGTFGSTFLARHRYLETLAAVKVINERFAEEPSVRSRFLREGRAVARLDHPHIARLQDFGEAGRALFHAMEYCEGGNLAERMKLQGPFSIEEWLLVAQQVASALVCCHGVGFIHRDLKPGNIMLAQPRGPLFTKLIDFGLVHAEARGAEGGESMTGAHFVGTPLYASPEQLREETIDLRSDLFALGMTLWHLAAGVSPETGTSAKIIHTRLAPETYASQLPSALPPPLRKILASLIEKDPARRPPSAAVVLAELNDAARTLNLPVFTGAAPATADFSKSESGISSLRYLEELPITPVAAELATEFRVLRAEGEQNSGINYLAERTGAATGRVWLHSIHPPLIRDSAACRKIRVALAKLHALPLSGVIRCEGLREYQDYTVAVLGAPAGEPLLAELKTRGVIPLAEALPLLESIAHIADELISAGLPGAEFDAGHLYVRRVGPPEAVRLDPQLLPRYLSSRDLAPLDGSAAPDDGSTTIAGELLDEASDHDNPAADFARLIYRVTAGRDCPAAASASKNGYIAVPRLGEGANRALSLVIARQAAYSNCTALLAELLRAEGLVAASRSGETRSSTARPSVDRAPAASARLPLDPDAVKKIASSAAATAPPPDVPPPADARSSTAHAPSPRREDTPPIPRESAPQKGRSPMQDWVRPGAVAAAVILMGFTLFSWLGKRSGEVPAPPPAPHGNQGGERAGDPVPAGAVARLVGDLPDHAEFFVGDTKAAARRAGGAWEVALGEGRKLPLQIFFQAKGYQRIPISLERASQLNEERPVALQRTKGTLAIRKSGPADYAQVLAEMDSTLPDEEGLVPHSRLTYATELRGSEEQRLVLPTGIYMVRFRSPANTRIVRPFDFGKVEIREGADAACAVPASLAGRFAGELRGPAGNVPVEWTIEAALDTGEITDPRAGTVRRTRVENGRLNADGTYTAVVKYSDFADPPAFDERMTARPAVDGSTLEVTSEEFAAENAGTRKLLGRDPDQTRTGTLRRLPSR